MKAKTFTVCFILLQFCETCLGLIMRDRNTGEQVGFFNSPTLSPYVGPSPQVCSNATRLVLVAVPSSKHLCDPATPDEITMYSGKMILLEDVFRKNPGMCSPEKMLRNAATAGAKALVSVVNRDEVGRGLAYKGTGEPSNEGSVPFLTVGKDFIANVSYDAARGNVTTEFVFDVTCDKNPYELAVFYVGPPLFMILGCIALRTAFEAFKGIRYYLGLRNAQVTQPAILFVIFVMQFVDGCFLVLGLVAWTTHSVILGDEVATYAPKSMFQNALMGFNLLATVWTGIFWSLLQKKISKLSTSKDGATNIFKEAPIRTSLSFVVIMSLEFYINISTALYNMTLVAMYAPLIMMASLCCGFYFYRQVNLFFKVTGFKSDSKKSSVRDSSTKGSPKEKGMKIPPFVLKLARSMKRFSRFLFLQVGAILIVFASGLNLNPIGQNVSSFVFASGTFGMAYYIVQGLSPISKKARERSNTNVSTSSVAATIRNATPSTRSSANAPA